MCCGGARTILGTSQPRADRRTDHAVPTVAFTYTGRTSLTVEGVMTGRLYRFEGTGATLPVDRRDAYGMSAVSVLRRG